MATRILIIDDDESLSAMLAEYLEGSGFDVLTRARAEAGLAVVADHDCDAVLLDIMLPDLDGFEACRRIREQSSIPILMLTARGEETDRIVGLEIGADDYLPKPFNPRELLARLRAVLRRSEGQRPERPGRQTDGMPDHQTPGAKRALRFGRLEIDREARVVAVEGEARTLTSHQFELLCLLAENAGRVLSRDQMMRGPRGHALEAFDRSIDNHVSRIRAAIEDDPKAPKRLITVRGAGYVFARSQDGDADA